MRGASVADLTPLNPLVSLVEPVQTGCMTAVCRRHHLAASASVRKRLNALRTMRPLSLLSQRNTCASRGSASQE
uniref:Uncharacterized protein n=1 Tax=Hyaloperonospora arabidopsidis (strain Emoy2) TaxID=559515 RepID=M4BWP9_HYAAE